MSNTYNNQNLLQDSVVFGNFVNCDVVSAGGTQANAKFKRNVLVGGDLTLGLETSTTTGGITTYTNTGGNIKVKINGITYTLTPTILKYLSTISSDVQTAINTIISNYVTTSSLTTTLTDYIDKNSNQPITGTKTFSTIPTYNGTALLSTLNDGTLVTAKFVKDQSYITTSSLNDNYSIGATTKLLTINSQLLATNGFFSTTLVYNAYTDDYNRFFGNFIMFYNFASAPTGSQLLPVILAGKSTTITFLNNTPYTLQLRSNTGSGIYGLVAPAGATVVSLLSGYTYTFIIFYGATAYDNWFCTVINTNTKLVDEGTDCSIAGTKTFSVAPLFSGTYPAGDSSTKLATTAWVKGAGFLTTASLTGLANLASPNFSGTPTCPTPVFSDNSTRIATTQYVQNNLLSFMPYNQYGVGGDITFTSGIYRYHIFKTNGSITFYKSSVEVNVFMIAGGGAGGRSHGGGGGAGEIVEIAYGQNITAGTVYTITVGGGGTVGGVVAGNSSFVGGLISASVNGGGRGGGAVNGGASAGGSGGGGSGYVSSLGGGGTTKVYGYGTIGGNGNKSTSPGAGGGGGGGGAGTKGNDALLTLGGAGGAGTNSYFSNYRSAILSYMPSTWQDATITGVIASGGSGGSWGNAVVAGPAGGGGKGGTDNGGLTYPTTPPTKGEDYTGSGGGGGGSDSQEGANGGSGLVVIRYVYNRNVTVDNILNYAAALDNPTFTTKITTPYISCTSPVYTFLTGEYLSNAQSTYTNSTPNVTYVDATDIWGWSFISNPSTNPPVYLRARLVNSVTSGYDISTYGWSNGYWKAPITAKYKICLTFYIISNVAGNRFRLIHNDSIGNLINSYYVLVEPTITTDVSRTYTNILNMSQGDYFYLELGSTAGTGIKMYLSHLKPNHTTLTVLQIC